MGAAITLAAWNDSELVQGNFGAGTFNLQGSTDNSNWTVEHDTPSTAAVIFNTTDHGNLAPDSTVYESFWVRLAPGTTSPATLSLAGITPGNGGNEANLSYRVLVNPTTCDAAGSATGTPIGSGTSLSTFAAGDPAHLAIGSPVGQPGAAVQLCFEVTAEAGLSQGLGASTVWEFEAVSTD